MLGILKWLDGFRRVLKGRPWFLPAPVTESEVAKFERAQGIRLPEDYRSYLIQVAGAPPGYAKGYELHECLGERGEYGDFLRTAFPQSQHWNEMDSEDYHDDKQVAGSLLLTHEGCDLYYRLVVTGKRYRKRVRVWGLWGYAVGIVTKSPSTRPVVGRSFIGGGLVGHGCFDGDGPLFRGHQAFVPKSRLDYRNSTR